MFEAWGRFVYRRRWLVLGVSAVVLALSALSLAQGGRLQSPPFRDTESHRARQLIQQELPQPAGPAGSSFILVFTSRTGLDATDPRFVAAMRDAVADLRADPRVRGVRMPEDTSPAAAALRSKDGKRAMAVVDLKDTTGVAIAYFPELRALVRSDSLEVLATGNVPLSRDIDLGLEADLQRAELVSLPAALILLLIVFASIAASLLTLGVGVLVIVGGLAATFFLARHGDVSQYAPNIVTLVGLGVAIDYSLFIVSRFREQLARGNAVGDAVAKAVGTAGRAVAFSGLTVAIGLSGMLFYPGTFVVSLGVAGSLVVAAALFYGLTFLPALLAILGPRVNAWRVPLPSLPGTAGLWHAIAMAVMRRPVAVLVPTLAFVLLAGSPFLQLRLAASDVAVLPPSYESRRAFEIVLDEFPGQDQSRITVVAHFPEGRPLSRENVGTLYDLSRRLAALPDVLRVEGPLDLDPRLDRAGYQALYAQPADALPTAVSASVRRSVGEHIAVLGVLTQRRANTDEARAIVQAIRADALPNGRILVTGATALDMDGIEYLVRHTPLAVGFVMLTTYIVLFFLLGSVVLPLKAIVMNVLSISASFGALVWVFQQGHLAGVLNFSPQSIEPSLPIIMFCLIFGLSMDYEVLLLSRIQEEYARTGDNAHAVAEGLERSGRLITGAAAIMIAVFSAFALADVAIIKAVGLGLGIAVALDATLVRAVIVPATMRLLGDWNWWAPPPLARLYGRVGLGHAEPVPVPAES